MKVSEDALARIVTEASQRMGDDGYVQHQVDRLMRAQRQITQYVVAHQNELSVEAIVTVLFHASLIQRGIIEATGKTPAPVGYVELDRAATSVPTLETLAEHEPNIASFIVSNFELDDEAKTKVGCKLLAHIAGALIGQV